MLAANSDGSTGVMQRDKFSKAGDNTDSEREVFYTNAKTGLVGDFKAEVARLTKAWKFNAFEKE